MIINFQKFRPKTNHYFVKKYTKNTRNSLSKYEYATLFPNKINELFFAFKNPWVILLLSLGKHTSAIL